MKPVWKVPIIIACIGAACWMAYIRSPGLAFCFIVLTGYIASEA